MAKTKRSNRKTHSRKGQAQSTSADPTEVNHVTYLLYGGMALFWLYAGISTAITAFDLASNIEELDWLIPATVGFFAVGWFLFHFVKLAALRERVRLAQVLLLAFFTIFLGGMLPFFFADGDVLRSGSQAYLSFGLAGLLLRMSTFQRQPGGLLGSFLSRR